VRGDIEKRNATKEEDTYSPVVQWGTVRLLLVLTAILGLHTRSIDFSNAFAQALIPDGKDIYIEVPKGFAPTDGRDCVMKLKKALYGSTTAPRLSIAASYNPKWTRACSSVPLYYWYCMLTIAASSQEIQKTLTVC
jgi:hypothetical protein